jgi:hypothetical protein
MKTSIEYLINEVSDILGDTHLNSMQYLLLADALKRSREMYKQELISFTNEWFEEYCEGLGDYKTPEIYYNETKNKTNEPN